MEETPCMLRLEVYSTQEPLVCANFLLKTDPPTDRSNLTHVMTSNKSYVRKGLTLKFEDTKLDMMPSAVAASRNVHSVCLVHVGDEPYKTCCDKRACRARDIIPRFLTPLLTSHHITGLRIDVPMSHIDPIELARVFDVSRLRFLEMDAKINVNFWARMVDIAIGHPTLEKVDKSQSYTYGYIITRAQLNLDQPRLSCSVIQDPRIWRGPFAVLIKPLTRKIEEILYKFQFEGFVFADFTLESVLKYLAILQHQAATQRTHYGELLGDIHIKSKVFCGLVVIKNCRLPGGRLPDLSAFRFIKRLRILGCGLDFDAELEKPKPDKKRQ